MNHLYNLNSLALFTRIWTEILKLFILNLIGRSFASIIFGGELRGRGDGERELSNRGVFLWAAWGGLAPASSNMGVGTSGVRTASDRRLRTGISHSSDPGDWVHI